MGNYEKKPISKTNRKKCIAKINRFTSEFLKLNEKTPKNIEYNFEFSSGDITLAEFAKIITKDDGEREIVFIVGILLDYNDCIEEIEKVEKFIEQEKTIY